MKFVKQIFKKIISSRALLVLTLLVVIGVATLLYMQYGTQVSQPVTTTSVAEPDITTEKKTETPPVQEPVEDIPNSDPTPSPTPTPVEIEDTNTWPIVLSLSESSDLSVVVNKKYQLPIDYVPALVATGQTGGGRMRPEAVSALTQLFDAASSAGYDLRVLSAYRSYADQQSTYNGYVAQYGQAETDTFSARPGHSEHQTGLAVDLGTGECDFDRCFGETAAGKWLQANAHLFGFIIRYPDGSEETTGYSYEPWHIRFLGSEIASAVVSNGGILETYFGKMGGYY